MEILYGAKNSVRAFGHNSTDSEPIWMNSGALYEHIVLEDFGRNPRCNNSSRGSRMFVFWSSK